MLALAIHAKIQSLETLCFELVKHNSLVSGYLLPRLLDFKRTAYFELNLTARQKKTWAKKEVQINCKEK